MWIIPSSQIFNGINFYLKSQRINEDPTRICCNRAIRPLQTERSLLNCNTQENVIVAPSFTALPPFHFITRTKSELSTDLTFLLPLILCFYLYFYLDAVLVASGYPQSIVVNRYDLHDMTILSTADCGRFGLVVLALFGCNALAHSPYEFYFINKWLANTRSYRMIRCERLCLWIFHVFLGFFKI